MTCQFLPKSTFLLGAVQHMSFITLLVKQCSYIGTAFTRC